MESKDVLQLKHLLDHPQKLAKDFYLNKLQSYLRYLKFFQDLSNDLPVQHYILCCRHLKSQSFNCGELICESEKVLDRVYIIFKGKVMFKALQGEVMRTYSEGVMFGENLLFVKKCKDFHIVAKQNCTLGYYLAADYKKLLEKYREEKRIALANFLAGQKSFANWKKSKIMEIIPYLISESYEKNHMLFTSQEPSDYIYIVIEGEIILFFSENISRLGIGSIIGIEEIKDSKLRNYSCATSTRSTLLTLSKYDFLRFEKLWENPDLKLVRKQSVTSWAGRPRGYSTSFLAKSFEHYASPLNFNPNKAIHIPTRTVYRSTDLTNSFLYKTRVRVNTVSASHQLTPYINSKCLTRHQSLSKPKNH